MRTRISRLSVATLIALSSFLLLRPAAGSGTPCRSVGLSTHPAWISSAVFVPALQKILLVDPLLNRLLLVSPSGQTTRLDNPATERAALPALLAPLADGFLLKPVGPTLFFLDKALNLVSESGLGRGAAGARSALGPFYQWTVAGRTIIAYDSLRAANLPGGYELGFLRLPATNPPGRPEMLLPFPNGDFYTLSYQYLAALGPVAYFVAMDRTATIYRVPPGAAPVALTDAVPEGFREVPTLHTQTHGPSDTPALYAELERATIPAGLYGGPDGFLYLLARRPVAGGTEWSIFQIDAAGNKIRGLGHLRSAAKHLTVVPSPDAWYFIERGDIEPSGRQEIGSMIAVPSARLTGLTAAGADLCPELGR